MACIKPKVENAKRCNNPENISGYKSYVSYCLEEDATTTPTAPAFTNTITGDDFMTAVATTPATAFGSTALWGKWEVKLDSLKTNTKAKSDFKQSAATMTTTTFEVDNNKTNKGILKKFKGASMYFVTEKPNDAMLWHGRPGAPARIVNYDDVDESESSTITVTVEVSPHEPLYLPAGTVLVYMT